ncbi:MAG: hypothetical protein AB1424_17510 [Thermodesulfobacteriota bacterium]
MHYNSEVFNHQIPILKKFVYHLIYQRELNYLHKEFNIQSEFWVHTMDAHLRDACIHWCMVFGSDKSNPTHWKNLFDSETKKEEDSFRQALFKEVGFDKQTWNEYWNNMKNFRDKYVAHREVDFKAPVPYLNKALEVAFVFDDWVRGFISYIDLEDNIYTYFEELPLRKSAEKLREYVKPFFRMLMERTIEYHKSCLRPV